MSPSCLFCHSLWCTCCQVKLCSSTCRPGSRLLPNCSGLLLFPAPTPGTKGLLVLETGPWKQSSDPCHRVSDPGQSAPSSGSWGCRLFTLRITNAHSRTMDGPPSSAGCILHVQCCSCRTCTSLCSSCSLPPRFLLVPTPW